MDISNCNGDQAEDGDRLSMLPDDILISILERLDICMAARTTALSSRWRHMPWQLTKLDIDVAEFLHVTSSDHMETIHIDEAMSELTKATRSLLAAPRREIPIRTMCLKLYLTSNHSSDIGLLVSGAIESGLVNDLDLAILDEKEVDDCEYEDMFKQTKVIKAFFGSFPRVLHCITRLSLYNVQLDGDIHHILFDCCTQLSYLYLVHCFAGCEVLWKINAPNSNIRFMEIEFCALRLDFVCLPKLEKIYWDIWICRYSPLSFGYVPNLKELHLICYSQIYFKGFKLSDVLHGTQLHTLTLDFHGEKLWIQPKQRQQLPVFNNLKKLSLLTFLLNLTWYG